jgi:hypothetical protein
MAEQWSTQQLWDHLSTRFDSEAVAHYRGLAEERDGFDRAKQELQSQAASASAERDSAAAKQRLVLAHLLLAIVEAQRHGRRTWEPLPPPHANWRTEEAELLMWAGRTRV